MIPLHLGEQLQIGKPALIGAHFAEIVRTGDHATECPRWSGDVKTGGGFTVIMLIVVRTLVPLFWQRK